MIKIIIEKMVLIMASMQTMLKAAKTDKKIKMKIEHITGTKIRTFLILADSIKEDNLEKENIVMIQHLVIVHLTTIEEAKMATKMIKTTSEIKHTAESGLTAVIQILKLSGKFGLVHWTEKLGRTISCRHSNSSEKLRISRWGKTLLLFTMRVMNQLWKLLKKWMDSLLSMTKNWLSNNQVSKLGHCKIYTITF